MHTVTVTSVIRTDHTLTVTVSQDIPSGPRTVIIVLDETTVLRSARREHSTGRPIPLVRPIRPAPIAALGDDGR